MPIATLEPGRTSWTAVLDAIRLGPDDDQTAVTASQVHKVIARLLESMAMQGTVGRRGRWPTHPRMFMVSAARAGGHHRYRAADTVVGRVGFRRAAPGRAG
jgi:hypothetical protein